MLRESGPAAWVLNPRPINRKFNAIPQRAVGGWWDTRNILPRGYVRLAIYSSQVQSRLCRFHAATLDKLFIIITQYKLVPAKGGDALKLGRCGPGKSNSSLSWVYDNVTCGLTVLETGDQHYALLSLGNPFLPLLFKFRWPQWYFRVGELTRHFRCRVLIDTEVY